VKLEHTPPTTNSVRQPLLAGSRQSHVSPAQPPPAVSLSASATATRADQSTRIHVQLKNSGATPALAAKLTLLNASNNARILPAYLSDNYVSLLSGETREIDVAYPTAAASNATPQIAIRGWNITPQTIGVTPQK
jgi:hypothetical protein